MANCEATGPMASVCVALLWAYGLISAHLVERESARIDYLVADMQARLAAALIADPARLAAEVSMLRRVGQLDYVEVRDEAGRVLIADGGPAVLGAAHGSIGQALESGRGRYDMRIDLLQPGRRAPVGVLRASVDVCGMAHVGGFQSSFIGWPSGIDALVHPGKVNQ